MQSSNSQNTPDGGRIWWLLLIWTGAVCVMTACSSTPKTKYEWLSVFLDGVPDPNAPVDESDIAPIDPVGELAVSTVSAEDDGPVIFMHAPYQERDCNACHASAYSNQLRLPQEELCFSCHFKDFDRARYFHAPALSGDCQVCHLPHSSDFEYLLVKDGAGLCLQCHDRETFSPMKGHDPDSAVACQTCHDPHTSARRLLLRRGVTEAGLP